MINRKDVVVFIPIFNAYEDVERCLKSVLKYTPTHYKILLLDDASTDERIVELNHAVSWERTNVKVYRNTENLGFVKNCNLAFQKTLNQDIVLLNSDTIVTENWLEKLINAAYSKEKIATVTPLTNNGTVCSVPNWLEVNEIPSGYTIENFAESIEKISLKKYSEIPTAVGFCMYIKREVLNKIGYFDENNFGKGYGEENDFCCRATQAGYIHIIDDATFVYHSGSKSFKTDKQQLIQRNLEKLEKLYPDYQQRIEQFITARSLDDILNNIQLNLLLDKIKQSSPICFILHNSTEHSINSSLGGTEYHCAALVNELRQCRPIYTLFFNEFANSILFSIFTSDKTLRFKFPIPNNFSQENSATYLATNESFFNVLFSILQYFRPSLIHIHHLQNLPIVVVQQVLRKINIPYFVSLHDYYFICPSQKLIDKNGDFCFEHKTADFCKRCAKSLFNEEDNFREKWLTLCHDLLSGTNSIILPSQSALSYYAREYPKLINKFVVIKHGIDAGYPHILRHSNSRETTHLNLPLKIAFVGSINQAKGSSIIVEMIKQIWNEQSKRDNFYFKIIGKIDTFVPSEIKNVSTVGKYNNHELAKLLNGIDIAIFPVLWAETYCLTLDEVLSSGIPVITTPMGAIQERVKEFDVGWISHSCSAEAILDILLDIQNNPSEYIRVKNNIRNYPLVSHAEMAQKYNEFYNLYATGDRELSEDLSSNILSPRLVLESLIDTSDPIFTPRIPLSEKYWFLQLLKRFFPGFWYFAKKVAKKLLKRN